MKRSECRVGDTPAPCPRSSARGELLGRERFQREIETTANLRHPHILPLYDSGEAGGRLFYVMPLVEGETLRARMDREQQLPLDDALTIAREVVDALSYAHGRGVIHRDIKPENILLEGGHAIVAGFGIALAAPGIERQALTRTGMAIGTPPYMSHSRDGDRTPSRSIVPRDRAVARVRLRRRRALCRCDAALPAGLRACAGCLVVDDHVLQ